MGLPGALGMLREGPQPLILAFLAHVKHGSQIRHRVIICLCVYIHIFMYIRICMYAYIYIYI